MTGIILPLDDCSLYNDLILTTTSSARADGAATNSATARLSRNGHPLSGKEISFYLSGDAQFIHNGQQITVITDNWGEATVFFTDIRQEIVWVTCYFHQTQASGSSRFGNLALPGLALMGRINKNGAIANGTAENYLEYFLLNTNGGPPGSWWIDFSVTGSAVLRFSERLSSSGSIVNFMKNTVSEQVELRAVVRDIPNVNFNAFFLFT